MTIRETRSGPLSRPPPPHPTAERFSPTAIMANSLGDPGRRMNNAPPAATQALGKWFAMLDRLRPQHCVSCNAMLVLMLTAKEIAAAANGGRSVLRTGGDAGEIVIADYGVIEITQDRAGGDITIRECSEIVFRVDPERGPVAGRWGSWIVTLAAIARQLEERFGHGPDHREHLH
jgi:hypothetical protein